MKPDQKSTDSCQEMEISSTDFPIIAPGEAPLEPPIPPIPPHAKLLLSWQGDDFLVKRRALMQSERFKLD